MALNHKGFDLSKIPTHKIVQCDNAAEFEKILNELVRSGWSVNINHATHYCQSEKAHKTRWTGVFVRHGI